MAESNSKRAKGGLWGSGKELHPLSQIPIQPAPVPRVPFVQAQRVETGGNLTRLAQSLTHLNQGLNNLANTQAQIKADPNSRENQEWIAKRQQMTIDQLREEAKNNTANGIRVREDALNLLLAETTAANFKRGFLEFYHTEFDKNSGDLATAFDQYRQQYSETLPNDLSRGQFYRQTETYKQDMLNQDVQQKVEYTVHKLTSALADSFRNTIEDGISQGKTPQEVAGLVFANAATQGDFISLDPASQNQALFELVKEYALQGNEEMVKALLEFDRGNDEGSLREEYPTQALTLIKQAGGVHREEKQDKDWSIIAQFNKEVREGTLDDERAAYYATTGSLSPARIGAGRDQSEANKAVLLTNQAKIQEAQAALDIHNNEKLFALSAAYDALEDVNGITRLKDVEIPNEKGTGTQTLTRQQLIDGVVERKEAEWEAYIAQAEDLEQALAVITQDRIKWYSSNNILNKRWEAQFSGLAARLPLLDLAKGGALVDHAKAVAALYRDIKSSNPAYLDSLSIDAKSLEFLEGYDEALELGMDSDAALLDASQMVSRPDTEKRKVRLEPSARLRLVEDIAYDLGVDERSYYMIEKKVERLSERGATETVIRESLKKELERTSFVHNGMLIFNHRDLPPDFLPLVNDILKQQHELYKKEYGLPDNSDDLYIDRDSTGSHWVIRSKSKAGMVVGTQTINADTLSAQRSYMEETRRVKFRQAIADSRHQERMRRDPDYHFEQETRAELDYWHRQLTTDKKSWPSQVIQNNIERLSDDLIHHQAQQLVKEGIYPNSTQWNKWKAEHGHDVRELEDLYKQHKKEH